MLSEFPQLLRKTLSLYGVLFFSVFIGDQMLSGIFFLFYLKLGGKTEWGAEAKPLAQR